MEPVYYRTRQFEDGLYYVINEQGVAISRGHFSSKGAYLTKRAIEKYRNRNARRQFNMEVAA